MKLVTLTLNPAKDKTLEVGQLTMNGLNIVLESHQDPGGKGINVAKVAKTLCEPPLALGFLAGLTGQWIASSLEALEVPHRMLKIEGETRTNTKIFCRSTKQITEINEQGTPISPHHLDQLFAQLKEVLTCGDILVLSGSVPPGVEISIYRTIIELANRLECRCILDASGALFKEGLKATPFMIKPNLHEIEQFLGHSINEEHEILTLCREWHKSGIAHCFISLGAQGGYYANAEGIWKWKALPVQAHSSVGAGDAFVAAVATAFLRGLDSEALLKLAVATSAGAVVSQGTKSASLTWINAQIPNVVLQWLGKL